MITFPRMMINKFFFFSASSTEQSIVNFKEMHPEVRKCTIWSDNGAHYKNTSLILWLGSLYQKTGMQITTYNNFEAQKGKTKLDSHYAILKFSLKAYGHKGHNILTPNDIVAAPLVEKKKTTALVVGKENQQQRVQIEEVSSNCLTKCPECGVCFLREGNLKMHRESKRCQKRKKSQRATDIGHSVLKDDECLASSLEKAKKFKYNTVNKTVAEIEIEKESQSQWNLTIQGTALKQQQEK